MPLVPPVMSAIFPSSLPMKFSLIFEPILSRCDGCSSFNALLTPVRIRPSHQVREPLSTLPYFRTEPESSQLEHRKDEHHRDAGRRESSPGRRNQRPAGAEPSVS